MVEATFLSLAERFQKHLFIFHDQENRTQREFAPLLSSNVSFPSLHFFPWEPPFLRIIDDLKISMSLLGYPDTDSQMSAA